MTDEWQDELRARGYRLTPQRELVLRAVNRLGHGTPDEILKAVREESAAVNVTTIYRNLDVLEELGLVRHTHLTDRAPTYHSTALPTHVHLVCRRCKRVRDADPGEFRSLSEQLRGQHDFEMDLGHLAVFGQCAEGVECIENPEG